MVYAKRSVSITGISEAHKAALQELFGGPSSDTGERIGRSSLWDIPPAKRGIELLASECSRIPWHLLRRTEDDGREKYREHPVYDLLTYRANANVHSKAWMQAMLVDAIIEGSGFTRIVRSEDGTPEALHNLPYSEVEVREHYDRGLIVATEYIHRPQNGVEIPLAGDDVIHIRNISTGSGLDGVGLLQSARNVIGLALARIRYASLYYKQGSHFSRYISIPGFMSPEQIEAMKPKGMEFGTGLGRESHRVPILLGGGKFESLPEDAERSQITQALEASITDFANLLGLPPYFLGGRGYTSYQSNVADDLNLLNHTLDNHLRNLEFELNSKLIRPMERPEIYIEAERKALTRGDQTEEIDRIERLYKSDLISFPEARQLMNKSTTRKGRYFSDHQPQATPEPPESTQSSADEPAPVRSQSEAATQPVATVAAGEASQDQRGLKLVEAALDRIKTRISRSVSKSPDLMSHEPIVRRSLDGLDAGLVMEDLARLQEELAAVLPEQRKEVISKWNTKQLAAQLWK